MKTYRAAVINDKAPKISAGMLWLKPDESGSLVIYHKVGGAWVPLHLSVNITQEQLDVITQLVTDAVTSNYPTREEVDEEYIKKAGGRFVGAVTFESPVTIKDLLNVNAVMTCKGIDVDGNFIVNLANPLRETDAVNKKYVDDRTSSIESNYMPKSGGTFTGEINMNGNIISSLGNPISADNAANKQYVDSGLSTKASASDVSDINAKIPAQASAQNQLADKNFVNSSIQTNTATFRGTYYDLKAFVEYSTSEYGIPDNNDYAVVRNVETSAWDADNVYQADEVCLYDDGVSSTKIFLCIKDMVSTPRSITPDQDTEYWKEWMNIEQLLVYHGPFVGTWRFKYVPNGAFDITNWQPEYQVNEKPLTAAQLAALNSGITDTKVAKLDALPTKPVDTQAQVLTDAEKNQARSNIGAGLAMISRTINANGSLAMKINTSCSLLITLYRTTAPIAQAVLLFQAYPQSGSLVCKCVLLSGEINNQSFNFDSVKAYGTYNGMWAGITQGSGLNITASIMSLDGGFPVDFADSFPGSLASTTPIEIKVGVVAQTLTDPQKAQARENIGIWSKTLYAEDDYLVIKATHLDGVFAITSSGENAGYALLSITLVNDITATIVSGEGWIDSSVDVQMGIDESDGKEILVVGLAADNFPIKVALLGGSEPESVYVTDAIAFDGEPESMPWTELGAGGGESDMFVAVEGATSVAEILAAVAANKLPVCLHNGVWYVYAYDDNSTIYFTCTIQNLAKYIRVPKNGDVWYYGQIAIENIANKVTTISGNENNTTKYPNTKAVADALGKMGIISQTQTWSGSGSNPRTYVMSDQVYGLIPQSFIDLVSASGVSFNDSGADKSVTDYFGNSVTHKAGCFLVGSIGDISYDEMRVIYNKTVGAIPIAGGSRNYLFASEADARATMPLHTTSSFGVTCQYMLYMSNIEELVFDSPLSSLYCSSNSHITSAFNGANRLRRISGAVLKWNMATAVTDPFKNCYSLESVKLYNIKTSFSFAQSPNLDLASVVYAVENAANGTSAITLTMHSTAYARCQADTTEYTYGGQTYTGIIALATAKNITIASA